MEGWEISSDVCEEEILPRLSANKLQILESVCKNWLQLISSARFIKLHLEVFNRSQIRILVQSRSAITAYNNFIEETEKIPLPYPQVSSSTTIILGSCDGLLCLLDRDGERCKIAVFNPSTGKCFVLKLRQHLAKYFIVLCSWFGRHPSSGKYVLVLGVMLWLPNTHSYRVGVYDFTRTSSLISIHCTPCLIDEPHLSCNEERGTLLHGAVHWPAAKWIYDDGRHFRRYIIFAYDLVNNTCLEIIPPAQCDFKLGVVDGCLIAIFKPPLPAAATRAERKKKSVFELWIMKEYGVQQSWTKYADIGFKKCRVLSPLGFYPNGDLILDADRCKLIKYNFNDNKSVGLQCIRPHEAIICADSLVSPEIWKSLE